MKQFLVVKNPAQMQNPTLTNKKVDQSHNSSDSNNSAKQSRQLHVDDVTLKQRATNKQIKILVRLITNWY